MDDEVRFRIYRNIVRRIVWERRAALALSFIGGVMGGAGLTLLLTGSKP